MALGSNLDRERLAEPGNTRDTFSTSPEPLYVCIYLAEFPAQALLRLRPELVHSAVVVMAGEPPLQTVCSLNTAAARLGVEHGMTLAELDTFPNLVLLRRSVPEERNARAALLESCGIYTPRLECQQVESQAFAVVLDMTGTTRIFGSAEQSLKAIGRTVAELRLHGRLAASANLHTAVSMAPSARKSPIVIPRGREAQFLRDLPLSALNPSAEQAECLALWGLSKFGELACLPETELVVRLGQEGRRLRLLARGEQPHLMVPEEPVFILDEYVAFESPVEILDSLLFVIGPMLDQLLTRANQRAFGLASVTVKLGLDGGGNHERTVKPALPVVQRESLLKLLQLDLQAHPPSAGVLSVTVHAEVGKRSKVQMGMFSPQLPEPMRLDVTLARIAALVGEERVGRGILLDTHKPDSFAIERFTVPEVSKQASAKDNDAAAPVALRRCRPPMDITVWRNEDRPASFGLWGKRYRVEKAYGPWRQSGEWWTADAWSCEEWDIHATANTGEVLLALITHDLLSHEWQIGGLYD